MVAAIVLSAVRSVPESPSVAGSELPKSMAALGDSMSRATNVCCRYQDGARHSWSTGFGPRDGVRSHYERLLASEPAIRGGNHNVARSGATIADLPRQAARAVAREAEYVTILVGANDACRSSRRTMTPVREFRDQFRSAMDALRSGLPRARIFVASIPDLYRLWEVYRDDPVATTVWRVAEICPSMLSSTNTEEDRRAVLDRVRAYNQVLARECARRPICRFDDHAVFSFRFERRHVSALDYFHPSLAGQAALASLTWERSWWSAAALGASGLGTATGAP